MTTCDLSVWSTCSICKQMKSSIFKVLDGLLARKNRNLVTGRSHPRSDWGHSCWSSKNAAAQRGMKLFCRWVMNIPRSEWFQGVVEVYTWGKTWGFGAQTWSCFSTQYTNNWKQHLLTRSITKFVSTRILLQIKLFYLHTSCACQLWPKWLRSCQLCSFASVVCTCYGLKLRVQTTFSFGRAESVVIKSVGSPSFGAMLNRSQQASGHSLLV